MPEHTDVTPERIFQIVTAFQQSAAFKSAVELDVFTNIGEGNHDLSSIAKACGATDRGIRILADYLCVLGLLEKRENLYYLNDLSSAFLDRRSGSFLGDAAFFLMSEKQTEGFSDLTNAVRRGGSTVENEGSLDPDSPMWVEFARSMTGMMVPSAQMMAEKLDFETNRELKVLDLAAGHGIFGIFIAQKYPKAEIYAVDWSNVLEVAGENAKEFGVAERHHKIPGSAFDVEFGDGYDVVLLTNFIHHFDQSTNVKLLEKIRRSLNENGRVLTLEFIPNDDRISPPMEAMFSLVMLAGTPAGDAYTFKEISEMFEKAGFSGNEHIPLAPMPQHLVISTI